MNADTAESATRVEHVFVDRTSVGRSRMRVLGIDPGLTRCGLGVVDVEGGSRLRFVAATTVRSAADLPIGERLVLLDRGIEQYLDEYQPDAVAVERVFSQHNVRTVMGTAQAGAVA